MPHVVNPLQQTSENKEKIHQTEIPRNNSPATNFSVAIVDGMAELQSLQKSKDIITCKDLAEAFASKVLGKYLKCDELHIIFDSCVEIP